VLAAAIVATGLAVVGIRLWSPDEWSHLALALGIGLLLTVLLVALTFVVRGTVQQRVRQSIDRLDAGNAFFAGIRGTAALGLGAVGLTLLLALAGFLALQGLDPPFVGAIFVVWAGAAAAFARPGTARADRRGRLLGARTLDMSALLFASVSLPMVLAYSDPLALSLVGHATLLGPVFGALAAIVAGVAAYVVRSRPERARADSFSRGLLAATAAAVVGVLFLTAWLLDFDLVYFAVTICGVGLGAGLASGGAWLAMHPSSRHRSAVLGAMGLAVPSVAVVAFWLGGWKGWPTATVWDGSLGLFAVALAGLGAALVGPALLVLGLVATEVPPEADDLPPDPSDALRGAWRGTVRNSGRLGEAALGTYLLGATGLVLLTFLATDVPLIAALLRTDTTTILTPSAWPAGTVVLGSIVGLAAGFLLSSAISGLFAADSRSEGARARRALTHPATVGLLAVALTVATALAGGPWSTLGLIPGALGGAALEMTIGLSRSRTVEASRSGSLLDDPTGTLSLAAIAFLAAVPLLLSATAYVTLLFAPIIHWSSGGS
jgi:hypothetical protein